MSRSRSIWQLTRLVAGAAALCFTPWTMGAVRVEGQQRSAKDTFLAGSARAAEAPPPAAGVAQRSLKQALLADSPRAADAPPLLVDAPRARHARSSPYVPGHIVVKFAADVSATAMSAMAADVGGTRLRRLHHADFVYVDIPESSDPVAAAARMGAKPGVVYAEPDGRVFAMFRPNDPFYQYQWNFQQIDMERTWDVNPGAKSSIVVAVIDSGVAYTSEGAFAQAPDLDGLTFVHPFDFIWDDEEPFDLDGHGTHVTGTIAQATNNGVGVSGMAFNVSIMPIKGIVTDWDEALGAPFPYGASTIARAIRYAADNGARIINLSIGGFSPNSATRDALVYAVDKGAFVACAAGNESEDGNPPIYPAAYAPELDGVMAVAAVDYGRNRAPYSNVNDYVEIAAPGGDLEEDLNDDDFGDGIVQQTLDLDAVAARIFNRFVYSFQQGTSMATAHVSGLAALLMDQGITTPAAVEHAIRAFATDLGPPGRDNETGYGLINPRATIRGLGLRR
jgi:serine protease